MARRRSTFVGSSRRPLDYSSAGPMASAQYRDGRFVCPQPFLQNNQAKQDFVIVMSAGGVLLVKFLHGARAKVLIDPGAGVEEGLGHSAVDRSAEPIHHVDRETAFGPLHNVFSKI